MSKLDELRKLAGGNAAESMGTRAGVPMHGASPPLVAASLAAPDRLRGVARSRSAAEIPIDRIAPDPDQPREEFEAEALQRLTESLRSKGQLQPIRVRWAEEEGQYVIICGERRWRAAGLAGLTTLQCIVAEKPADAGELLAIQLIENCVREDLRPVEQAKAFRQLADRNGWSTRQIARELGVDQSHVVRSLALLDLPAAVQDQVEQGALPASVAYEVSKLADTDSQVEVAAQAVSQGLNRSEVVATVRRTRSATNPGTKGRGGKVRPKPTSATLRTESGCKVTFEHRRGVDSAVIRQALAELLARVDAEANADAA